MPPIGGDALAREGQQREQKAEKETPPSSERSKFQPQRSATPMSASGHRS
jgi:hypothetical protein